MTERMSCQVCGRMLVPLKDGTSRRHTPRRAGTGGERNDYARCAGSGYRMARWEVGQVLVHHTGILWKVLEDRGGRSGDYLIECIDLRGFPTTWGERVGRQMVTHGEYMHRDGWEAAA